VLPILEDKNRERQNKDGQKWRKTKQGRGEGRGEHAQSFIVRCTFLGIKYYFIVTTLVTRVVNWLSQVDRYSNT
jgi:hypothetical protein